MKNYLQRGLIALLAVLMVAWSLPLSVLAEDVQGVDDEELTEQDAEVETQASSGTCGDNLTWTLDDAGTLTISGTGAMEDYEYTRPWSNWEGTIRKVVVENGATGIGGKAFAYCSSLTSITLPDSVTSIGDEAFSDCESLVSITLPDNIKSIGYQMFYGCSSLRSITLPVNLASIGEGVFFSCKNLTSITLPDSVISIGDAAFIHCSGLTNIELSNCLTSIGNEAFEGCSGLTSIVLPNSLTHIGMAAFYECSSLTSIMLPKSVTSIGLGAFTCCDSLMSIDTDLENPSYSSILGVLFNKDQSTLIRCPGGKSGDYLIPDGVQIIDPGAFQSCCSIINITLPDSVTNIGTGAFYHCTNLNSIMIPESVTSIGDEVFKWCDDFIIYGYNGSYAETYANQNNFPFRYIERIELLTTPERTTYIQGQPLDTTGGTIKITYSDGTSTIEKIDIENCSGYRSNRIGIQTIIVTISKRTTSFTVVVNQREAASLTLITPPTKLTYTCGEVLDTTGLIVEATYNDETKENVKEDELTISGYNKDIIGKQIITISYKNLSVNFTVTVEEKKSTLLLGDVNGDGQINASDALQDLRHSVKEIILDGDAFTRGNVVSTDDVINASDALQILRYSVKEITSF